MPKEFFRLFDTLVPHSGQAATVQGELVRAIGKMAEEYVTNGFSNWDSGYEHLADFSLARLTDGSFSAATNARIQTDVAQIRSVGRGEDSGGSDLDKVFARLMEASVVWCLRHPTGIPHTPNPELKR